MRMIPFEKRGISNSRIVLGCMSLGGGWNSDPLTQADYKKAEGAIDAALSSGITMFDHADIYTNGKAEIVFGQVLKTKPVLRENLVIQSKCGIRWGNDRTPGRFDFSKSHILNSVDGILQRLGTEYLDILLLHRPDPLMEPEEVAEAFSLLKESGKVRHFGVSNMNAQQIRFLQQAMDMPLVANQMEMSLARLDWLDQGIHVNQQAGLNVNFAEGLMEYAQMENIQIQAYGSLAQGKFTKAPSDNDPDNVRKTAELVIRLAEEKGTSPEAIVLGWLMRHPARIQPVIGTANPERILACQDAVRQAELMSRDDWYALYVSSRGKDMP
ncbi:aldo/keto reductase [Paenibacillus glycanilyticus]|uniref:Aldo/keto reductase n=1 Tax=Paenibacillus glycanilyticus TaxID=126569 RepID=A0ABQ6G7E1_9BACL|nr:aldo/keto reductase [Paenibacillus glycanilyticus]GLX66901.1 aldo/keto reductase [Paenibacillus glycanilyticus]